MTDDITATTPESASSYPAFIQQIELVRIWLKSSKVVNADRNDVAEGISVQIIDTSTWNASDSGFTVYHKYSIKFRDQRNRRLGDIEVEFGLSYASTVPMTDDLFELFGEHNLPLNSWPYLREYLASTLGRMGWPAFTLPVRKIVSG
jgi:hypothetical protein